MGGERFGPPFPPPSGADYYDYNFMLLLHTKTLEPKVTGEKGCCSEAVPRKFCERYENE